MLGESIEAAVTKVTTSNTDFDVYGGPGDDILFVGDKLFGQGDDYTLTGGNRQLSFLVIQE